MDSKEFDRQHEKKQMSKRQKINALCNKVNRDLGKVADGLDSYFDDEIIIALERVEDAIYMLRATARSR